jgi:hypothetical protein
MNQIQKSNDVLSVGILELGKLMDLPEHCIYAFRNPKTKLIQIFGTACMLGHIMRILPEIKISGEWKALKDDLENIELCILETNVDPIDRRLRQAFWINKYRYELCYELYKDVAPIRFRTDIQMEYQYGKLCYFVYLMNTRKDRRLIGIFSTKKEMMVFLDTHYPRGVVSKIIFHESTSRCAR